MKKFSGILFVFIFFLLTSVTYSQWWVKGGNLIWPYGDVTIVKGNLILSDPITYPIQFPTVLLFSSVSKGIIGKLSYNQVYFGDSAGIGSGGVMVALGRRAGYDTPATGNDGIFIGDYAGELTDGEYMIGIGNGAGQQILETSFEGGIFIGRNTGRYSTGGGINIGGRAGQKDSSESNSIKIGVQSGEQNSGADLKAFGTFAGQNNTGNDCVLIGDSSGFGNTTNDYFELRNGSNVLPLISGNFGTGNVKFDGMSSDSTTCSTGEFWFNASTGSVHRKF